MFDPELLKNKARLKEIHKRARDAGFEKPMKAAIIEKKNGIWTFKVESFTWQGEAHDGYEARIKGWEALLNPKRFVVCI